MEIFKIAPIVKITGLNYFLEFGLFQKQTFYS